MKIKLAHVTYVIGAAFAFGGKYLFHIAPPTHVISFAVGTAEAITLVAGLILLSFTLSASAKTKKCFAAGFAVLFLAALCFYIPQYQSKVTVLESDNDTVVMGKTLTPWVKQNCPDSSHYDACLTYFRQNSKGHSRYHVQAIWTSTSIFQNEITLLIPYCLLAFSICSVIFLVTDLNETDKKSAG